MISEKFIPNILGQVVHDPIRTQTTSRGPLFIFAFKAPKTPFPIHIRPEAHRRPFFSATPKRYFVDSRIRREISI